jgi:hypothetical protein
MRGASSRTHSAALCAAAVSIEATVLRSVAARLEELARGG